MQIEKQTYLVKNPNNNNKNMLSLLRLSRTQKLVLTKFYNNFKAWTPKEMEKAFKFQLCSETIHRAFRKLRDLELIRKNSKKLGQTGRISNYILTKKGELAFES